VYPYLLFFAFLQAAAPQGVPLLENCSEPQSVLATLRPTDNVRVRASVAGEAQTCYGVTAVIDGRPVKGYILDKTFPAVLEFERRRSAAAPVGDTPAPVKAADQVIQPPRPRLPVFADFSARDLKGKQVSLGGLKGKVILVCFWSPLNDASQRELIMAAGLFGKFHRQGLDALAISLDASRARNADALDDFGVTFSDIPGGFEIANRHNIASDTIPQTFILNDRHEILAAGLHGKELDNAVQKLMKGE
jgi:peroxiredoxin